MGSLVNIGRHQLSLNKEICFIRCSLCMASRPALHSVNLIG